MDVTYLPEPGEAAWRIGILDKTLDTLKESAARAARRLPGEVPIQEIFDRCCEAHNDLHTALAAHLLYSFSLTERRRELV